MSAHPDSALILELQGQNWPLQHGDVIGRFGTAAAEQLRSCDVLSRQHLRVEHIAGAWHVVLLPNVRNATHLAGRLLVPGRPTPLSAVNDITIHTLQLRLRLQPKTPRTTLPDTHPAALITLDESLVITALNQHAARLLGPGAQAGTGLARLLTAESLIALRLHLHDLPADTPGPEITLHFSPPAAPLHASFQRENNLAHGVLRPRENPAPAPEPASQPPFRSETLRDLLAAPAFLHGDPAQALPLLAQTAAAWFSSGRLSLWLETTDGLFPAARSHPLPGAPSTPLPRPAELDLPALQSAGLVAAEACDILVHQASQALLIIERHDRPGWSDDERQHAALIATLVEQIFANAARLDLYEKQQQRESAILAELAEASRYVARLLPPPLTTGPVQVEWSHQPCGQLAGDVFGYEWLDPGHFALYLIDVAGHGAGAALLAVSLVNTFRLWTARREPWLHDPAAWLREGNTAFPMEKHGGLTCTLWCGIYATATHRLTYASAGHPPAILLQKGKAQALTAAGPVGPILGALAEADYRHATVTLAPGARLYIYIATAPMNSPAPTAAPPPSRTSRTPSPAPPA